MPTKPHLALILATLVAGCNNAQDTAPAQESSQAAPPVKSAGTFYCHAGAPGRGYQVAATADVAPGANAAIKLDVPPSPLTFDPALAVVRCQVDVTWCDGASCRGNPPVDFYGDHSNGLAWEASTSDTSRSVTFKAVAHNADKVAHTVRLVLELPPNWRPSTPDAPAKP